MNDERQWVAAGPVSELERNKRRVVDAEPDDIVVWWSQGRAHALRNICIHQDRELAAGSILGDRLVCPGHQWAFDLTTGHCKERDRCQPVYETKIEDGQVYVDPTPRQESDPTRLQD